MVKGRSVELQRGKNVVERFAGTEGGESFSVIRLVVTTNIHRVVSRPHFRLSLYQDCPAFAGLVLPFEGT